MPRSRPDNYRGLGTSKLEVKRSKSQKVKKTQFARIGISEYSPETGTRGKITKLPHPDSYRDPEGALKKIAVRSNRSSDMDKEGGAP